MICASSRRSRPGNRGVDARPWRLVRRKLPPEIANKLRELAVAKTVLEAGHGAESAGGGRGDAVQDHLDQIVRRGAVQIAVQGKRGARSEQRRAADLMAHRAGALIEPRAGRGGPAAGARGFELCSEPLLLRRADRGVIERGE